MVLPVVPGAPCRDLPGVAGAAVWLNGTATPGVPGNTAWKDRLLAPFQLWGLTVRVRKNKPSQYVSHQRYQIILRGPLRRVHARGGPSRRGRQLLVDGGRPLAGE